MFIFFLILLFLRQPGVTLSRADPLSYTFLKLIREASRGIEKNVDSTIIEKLDSLSLDDYNQFQSEKSGQLDHQVSGSRPQVAIRNGLITGETIQGSHAFYSIPYGKAPVGPLRFKPSEPAEDFFELNASLPDYRMCWQIKDCDEDEPNCRDSMSEDCLILNINVPENIDLKNSSAPPNERLPVLVWFHGGFFFRGRSTTTKYDGRWLSPAINAVVVTVNYRLGPLGFLSFQDDQGFVEGNQGLKDQQLALKWVQDNISKFGGDKNRVTIFSNSAGSQSVNFHLVSPLSDPLFQRGITQSGAAVFLYQSPQDSMKSVTSKVLDYVGCGESYDCLRSASAESITYSRNTVMAKLILEGDFFGAIEPFRPVIDGTEFTDQPLTLFKTGKWQNHKEFLLGFNQDEMAYISAFFQDLNLPMPKFLFEEINNLVLGTENGQIINELYEERFDIDLSDNLANELTDLLFVCPNRAIARHAAQTSTGLNSRVYFYNNAYAMTEENCKQITDFGPVCGSSYHSSEQVFVFKSADGYETSFSSDDLHMSDVFTSYWGNFAANGDPSSGVVSVNEGASSWPNYESTSAPPWINIKLENPNTSTQYDYRGIYCDVWDQINYQNAFQNYYKKIKTY